MEPAPELDLIDKNGQKVALHHFWERQPIILTFLRHFGCAFCRDHLVELRDGYRQVLDAGAEVIGITQGDPLQTRIFGNRYRLPYPLLSNPDRSAYHAFGLYEGSRNDVVGPVLFMRKPLFMTGAFVKPEPMVGELRQLGGVYVIDRSGTIVYAHQSLPIYMYPTLDELLALVRAIPAR